MKRTTDRDRDFGKQYHVFIDRVYPYLSATAQRIYPVLLRCANCYHRCTDLTQGQIGKAVNRARPMKQPQVSRGIRELMSWGVVQWKITSRGRVYYLPRKEEIEAFLAQREPQPPPSEPDLSNLPADIFEVEEQLSGHQGALKSITLPR